eukprot:2307136-Rhodomonas_salina.2
MKEEQGVDVTSDRCDDHDGAVRLVRFCVSRADDALVSELRQARSLETVLFRVEPAACQMHVRTSEHHASVARTR